METRPNAFVRDHRVIVFVTCRRIQRKYWNAFKYTHSNCALRSNRWWRNEAWNRQKAMINDHPSWSIKNAWFAIFLRIAQRVWVIDSRGNISFGRAQRDKITLEVHKIIYSHSDSFRTRTFREKERYNPRRVDYSRTFIQPWSFLLWMRSNCTDFRRIYIYRVPDNLEFHRVRIQTILNSIYLCFSFPSSTRDCTRPTREDDFQISQF